MRAGCRLLPAAIASVPSATDPATSPSVPFARRRRSKRGWPVSARRAAWRATTAATARRAPAPPSPPPPWSCRRACCAESGCARRRSCDSRATAETRSRCCASAAQSRVVRAAAAAGSAAAAQRGGDCGGGGGSGAIGVTATAPPRMMTTTTKLRPRGSPKTRGPSARSRRRTALGRPARLGCVSRQSRRQEEMAHLLPLPARLGRARVIMERRDDGAQNRSRRPCVRVWCLERPFRCPPSLRSDGRADGSCTTTGTKRSPARQRARAWPPRAPQAHARPPRARRRETARVAAARSRALPTASSETSRHAATKRRRDLISIV